MQQQIVRSHMSGSRNERHATKALAQSNQAAELDVAMHRNLVAAEREKALHLFTAAADLADGALSIEAMLYEKWRDSAYGDEVMAALISHRLTNLQMTDDQVLNAFARKLL